MNRIFKGVLALSLMVSGLMLAQAKFTEFKVAGDKPIEATYGKSYISDLRGKVITRLKNSGVTELDLPIEFKSIERGFDPQYHLFVGDKGYSLGGGHYLGRNNELIYELYILGERNKPVAKLEINKDKINANYGIVLVPGRAIDIYEVK